MVLETGNPAAMPWRDKVRAIVQAWYPGQAGGQAIAEVLTGAVNPSGRLPLTFPADLAQTPRPELPGVGTPWGTPTTIEYGEGAEVGYRWYARQGATPMYAFGHGLSYTTFAYGDLHVEGGDTVTASFTVTNTGDLAGADVPQLYLTRRRRRPAYAAARVRAGRSWSRASRARVTVAADPRLLARYDRDAGQWHVAAAPTGSRSAGPPTISSSPARRSWPSEVSGADPRGALGLVMAQMPTRITGGPQMALQIGDTAPGFRGRDDRGKISFHDWLGDSWGVLFSHPKDFTPVCTTELGYMASIKPEFDKRNVKIIGLSVDPVDSHAKWAEDIEETQGNAPNYPMIGDPDLNVSKLYGMLPADVSGDPTERTPADNQTVRNVFVVGPDKKIKLILVYPMTTGRNFDEVLRVIDSLQLTAKHKVATPVNWKQGDDVIIAGSVSDDEARETYPDGWKSPRPVHPDRAAAQLTGPPSDRPHLDGRVLRADADVYADYIRETGFAEYGRTAGNRGAGCCVVTTAIAPSSSRSRCGTRSTPSRPSPARTSRPPCCTRGRALPDRGRVERDPLRGGRPGALGGRLRPTSAFSRGVPSQCP